MALKYADYAKRQDEAIDQEIVHAQEQTEQRRDIPESVKTRFDGKTVEDVMESFAKLERKLSEQGQTVGELRRQNDQLLALQLRQEAQPQRQDTTESVEPLTVDELYDNPGEAIGREVESRTKKQQEKIDALEERLAKQEADRAKALLDDKFPNWEDEVLSNEFLDWVKSSRYRTRSYLDADNGDLDAANDLLGEWYERKQSTQELSQRQMRERQLNDAAMETSSPAGMQEEQTFSRLELTRARVRAKQGDLDAQDWLTANSDAIHLAYEEGRITD